MASKIILILGAGPRIGLSVARKFKAGGYQVAVASRNPDLSKALEEGFHPISVDLASTQSIEEAFIQVEQELGIPNVVVYNAAALTFPQDPSDPFAISTEDFTKDLIVNLTGAYDALRLSTQIFKRLPTNAPRVFIATGNSLHLKPFPVGMTLGTGKSGLVHLIDIAVQSYGKYGMRYYFAAQVTEQGNPVKNSDVRADTHGEVYWDLANKQEQGSWNVSFLGDGRLVSFGL